MATQQPSSNRRKFVTIILAIMAAGLTVGAILIGLQIQQTQAPTDIGACQCCGGIECNDGTTAGPDTCAPHGSCFERAEDFCGVGQVRQDNINPQCTAGGAQCPDGSGPIAWCATFICPEGDTSGDGQCTTADRNATQTVRNGNNCNAIQSGQCGQRDFYRGGTPGVSWNEYCGHDGLVQNSCTVTPNPVCGDGNVDNGEQCDDGNNNNADSCRNNCTLPVCGDGINDNGEQCDDGNENNNDSCRNNCTLPVCGDGITDPGEECDDGNRIDNDTCSNSCTRPALCGDGTIDPGETCDPAAVPTGCSNGDTCNTSCACIPTSPICGNGTLDPGEECDDGNNQDGDGCSSTCTEEGEPGTVTASPFCQDGTSLAEVRWTENSEGVRIHIDDDPIFPNDDAWWFRFIGPNIFVASVPTGFTHIDQGPLVFSPNSTYYVRVFNEETRSYTNTVSFVALDCTDDTTPGNTCGDPCNSTGECTVGHVCDGGRCVLTQCVGNSSCTNNGCVLPLPDTALVSDEADRLILGGLLLVVAGAMVYRFRLADLALGTVIDGYDKSYKIRSSRSKFEDKLSD